MDNFFSIKVNFYKSFFLKKSYLKSRDWRKLDISITRTRERVSYDEDSVSN